MTIPEAVELVLAAGAIGDDRRILVLEMGNPVKIDTLARQMIELSGFVPDLDIPIVYSGLKPGEKEYEELLTDDENVTRTDHDRIWVLQKAENNGRDLLDLEELKGVIKRGNSEAMREFVHAQIQGIAVAGRRVS